ncbi:hypothetical protein G5I_07069 [Acromyrmex echinatior]|uniref:Uncharacterized protein n=1 Tax=Acromyrmex echinatior TaxID=103372 RepID=F4WMT5_ACREC|nr:hypothetical protein G5I_07069 [Acromyrmex echinatior]
MRFRALILASLWITTEEPKSKIMNIYLSIFLQQLERMFELFALTIVVIKRDCADATIMQTIDRVEECERYLKGLMNDAMAMSHILSENRKEDDDDGVERSEIIKLYYEEYLNDDVKNVRKILIKSYAAIPFFIRIGATWNTVSDLIHRLVYSCSISTVKKYSSKYVSLHRCFETSLVYRANEIATISVSIKQRKNFN